MTAAIASLAGFSVKRAVTRNITPRPFIKVGHFKKTFFGVVACLLLRRPGFLGGEPGQLFPFWRNLVESEANYGTPSTESNSFIGQRKLEIGTTKYTEVFSCDEKGAGGAHHVYVVKKTPEENDKKPGEVLGMICFQNGPIKEAGVNGVANEDLICIVIDRLSGFQSGLWACQENADAKMYLEEALCALRSRTMKREARGVEGTHTI